MIIFKHPSPLVVALKAVESGMRAARKLEDLGARPGSAIHQWRSYLGLTRPPLRDSDIQRRCVLGNAKGCVTHT